MQRIAQIKVEDNGIGSWELTCETCPLLPHTQALEQPPPVCMRGLLTGLQGAVPLKRCKWHKGQAEADDNKVITLECVYGQS